jgi:electron transfer flavoprotein beta subunit
MKILVPVKRVVDYSVRIRVKSDQTAVELAGVKMSMNPFDEIAVEEAVRLKERGVASEVIALSIGADAVVETLRSALAMGADRAVHLRTEDRIEPLGAAKLIAHYAKMLQPDLVILGKQAIDDDANQTGQMLAAMLNMPQATFASEIRIEDGHVVVVREVDGGLMTVRASVPCIITTDLRLNQPRYASLPNIMKARAKPLEVLECASLGVDYAPRLRLQKVTEPPKRAGGIKVADIDTLIEKLKTEAKVL